MTAARGPSGRACPSVRGTPCAEPIRAPSPQGRACPSVALRISAAQAVRSGRVSRSGTRSSRM
eukprot:3933681-Rhodomonas_salina.1